MSIGTGLFLGCALVALTLLFTQTKDRWRWKRIATWSAVVICFPFLVGLIWFGYLAIQTYIRERPRPITKYADVSLGDSLDEVLYAKGYPTTVLVDDASLPDGAKLPLSDNTRRTNACRLTD